MKTIKEVKIVFENCEEVVIKPEHFAVLDMEHIEHKISRIASNSIAKVDCVGTVAMKIFS